MDHAELLQISDARRNIVSTAMVESKTSQFKIVVKSLARFIHHLK